MEYARISSGRSITKSYISVLYLALHGPTFFSDQVAHCVPQTERRKSVNVFVVLSDTFPEDAGRNTSDVSSPSFSCIWNFRGTRSVRCAAPISEAREIALRAQTAVSIAALLIIAICHKFWVIVTAYRSRGFIRGTVVCGVVEGRATMLLNARRNRAAAGNYDGAIHNVRLLRFVRKTNGILHQANCTVIAAKSTLWTFIIVYQKTTCALFIHVMYVLKRYNTHIFWNIN